MRVLMISSHYLGVLYLEELLLAGEEVVGAVALPGTGGWFIPPEYDFRAAAFRNYIPVYEPPANKLNSPEFLSVIKKLAPDYIISGYYPKIFGKKLLGIPKYGCINTHPTGLPRFRGLSPYFSHLLFGDTHNMITMHWLDPGVDTGDIIFKASVPIEPEDTGFVSGHKVTEAAAETFRKVWPLVKAGKSDRIKQSIDEASIFNFDERMAEIDWSQSAFLINNLVKAITKPLFGTWTTLNGQKIMIWKTRLLTGSEETNAKSDVPGTVTAVTVPGFCVQCETGQIEVLEYEFCDSQAEIVGFSLDDILNIVLSSGSVKCIEIKEN